MKTTNLIIIGILVILVISGISFWYSVNQSEIKLRNLAKSEIEKVEIIHDEVFKVISQGAQVTTEYREGFEEIYTGIMQGRYSGGSQDGSLMKWIQESNPEFTPDLYKKLMVDIEVLRGKFAKQQIRVEDIIREHNNLIQDPLKSIVLKNTDPIEYIVISSAVTKKVIETREDNEIDLFKK